MPTALKTWWEDPTHKALIARFLVFIFGALVKSGKIPTGYEGLGDFIGPFVMGGSLLIPAGQMNASGAVTHSTTTTTKVVALEPPPMTPVVVPLDPSTALPTPTPVYRGAPHP